MKRYTGRRTKPRLSQWCARRVFVYESWEPGRPRRSVISGHAACQGVRWHSRDHVDCCGSDDERESYTCQCPCHPSGPSSQRGR